MPNLRFRFVSKRDIPTAFITWSEDGIGWRFGFSHVGVMRFMDGELYEFGARLGVSKSITGRSGVQYRPHNYAKFYKEETVYVPCTNDQYELFWDAAEEIKDKRYSLRTIFGFALGFQFHDESGFICSALMPYLLYRAGMLPRELVAQERHMNPLGFFYLALGLREGTYLGRRSSPAST